MKGENRLGLGTGSGLHSVSGLLGIFVFALYGRSFRFLKS